MTNKRPWILGPALRLAVIESHGSIAAAARAAGIAYSLMWRYCHDKQPSRDQLTRILESLGITERSLIRIASRLQRSNRR